MNKRLTPAGKILMNAISDMEDEASEDTLRLADMLHAIDDEDIWKDEDWQDDIKTINEYKIQKYDPMDTDYMDIMVRLDLIEQR